MQAASLLTPVVACLDPRARSPIINSRATVRAKLRVLGLSAATLPEQFDGLTALINQGGFVDAFALDRASPAQLSRKLPRPVAANVRRSRTTVRPVGNDQRPLPEYDDSDVKVLLRALTRVSRRMHNTMTTTLGRLCAKRGLDLLEGRSSACRFDALVQNYRGNERHLLIEVKTSDDPASCRLAVGQLLDYRRQLADGQAADLAVMFPKRPKPQTLAFLGFVGVYAIWIRNGRVVGDIVI